MPERHIRVSARGLVRRKNARHQTSHPEDELLVARDYHPNGDPFYYPLGGGVEFGEHSADALHREFDEELGVSLSNVGEFGTYEEVFTTDGQRQHEVWRVYEADIAESWPYEEDEFSGYEAELDEEIECVWKQPTAFSDGKETLYPDPLVEEL